MPEVEQQEIPVSESDISLAEYRKQREDVTPATAEEPVKTADGTEPPKAENSEEEEAGKEDKPKGGFQRRIDKLTKENAEKERALAERDKALTDLTARLEALEKPKAQVVAEAKADGDPKPRPDGFKEYDEYIEALSKWTYRQERKAEQETSAKTQREQAEQQTQSQKKAQFDKFLGEMGKVREANPDYDAVFAEAQIPDYIHAQLVRMEKGAEVAYALAKDKETLSRIVELNNKAIEDGHNDFSEAYWEFGSFVRSLSKQSSPKPERPVSQAPAPISPVRGGDAPSKLDTETMDLASYRKARESGRIR